jgi:hypothetical protein
VEFRQAAVFKMVTALARRRTLLVRCVALSASAIFPDLNYNNSRGSNLSSDAKSERTVGGTIIHRMRIPYLGRTFDLPLATFFLDRGAA